MTEEETASDKIDEWQIDGFQSFTEEKSKNDAHDILFLHFFFFFLNLSLEK